MLNTKSNVSISNATQITASLRTADTFETFRKQVRIAPVLSMLSTEELRVYLGIGNKAPSDVKTYKAYNQWQGPGRYELAAAKYTTPYLTEIYQLDNWHFIVYNGTYRQTSTHQLRPAAPAVVKFLKEHGSSEAMSLLNSARSKADELQAVEPYKSRDDFETAARNYHDIGYLAIMALAAYGGWILLKKVGQKISLATEWDKVNRLWRRKKEGEESEE